MADRNITPSTHLLKRLEAEIAFLGNLMYQVEVVFLCMKSTWNSVNKAHENLKRDEES